MEWYYNTNGTVTTNGDYDWSGYSVDPDSGLKISSCAYGHKLNGSFTCEDGLFIGYCQKCGAQVEFPYIPGGMNLLEAQDLLRRCANGADIAALGELNILLSSIEKEIAALERAKETVMLARFLMAQEVWRDSE